MDDKKKDWLFRVFLTISLVWTAGVSWFLFKDQVLYNGYSPMPLNEIGDFLAGSFSPLAFFWLAYGYFMQNSELKLNRKSLEKKIAEFEKSVANTQKSLKLAEEKYKNEKESVEFETKINIEIESIIFKSTYFYEHTETKEDFYIYSLELKIRNIENTAFNFHLNSINKDKTECSYFHDTRLEHNISLSLYPPTTEDQQIEYIEIMAKSSIGKDFYRKYKLLPLNSPGRFTFNEVNSQSEIDTTHILFNEVIEEQ